MLAATPPSAIFLADRVRVLETNLQRLTVEVAEHRQELSARLGKEVTKLEEAIVQLRTDIDAEKETKPLSLTRRNCSGSASSSS